MLIGFATGALVNISPRLESNDADSPYRLELVAVHSSDGRLNFSNCDLISCIVKFEFKKKIENLQFKL